MSNVTFRSYRAFPAATRVEVRARAEKMQRRFARLLMDNDADQDELYVALRDAWLFFVEMSRYQPEPRRQHFSDTEIRAAAKRGAAQSRSIDEAYGKTVEILEMERRHSISMTALKRRLLRIGRFDRV